MGKKVLQFLKERIATIIFFVIVVVLVLVGLKSVKKAKSNAIKINDEYEVPEKTADLLGAGEYVTVASNEYLELLYCDVKGAIQVKDKRTGHLWKSVVDPEVYPDMNRSNKQWQANMQSAINIKYSDIKKRDSGVKEVYAGQDCGFLESVPIENGVEVTYGFIKSGIYVTVDYSIDGENLVVKVPYEKIKELSKYALTTISVLPYLGACDNSNSGYIFYPDGSGAVTTFERVGERPASVKGATYYTYSNKTLDFATIYADDLYDRYTAAFPVYGIKNGNDALFAYATNGAENMGVVVNPSGVVIGLNRTCFDFYVRNVFNVDMYSVSTGTDTKSTGGVLQRVDKELIKEDKEIRYVFLSGDKANYSGMAEVYRDYLIENGMLGKTENVDNTALALRILMGTEKGGILFDEYVKMTDFNQTIEIMDRLKELGIEKTNIVLEGWQKNYDEFTYWGPDWHLGGAAGLKKISKYAKENNNVDIYLENSFMVGSSKTKGLDEKKEVAYNGINVEVSLEEFDGSIYYFLNPNKVKADNSKFLKKLKKYDGIGVAYEDVARFAYVDYNEWHPYMKSDTVKELQGILKEADNSGRNIAINGNNAYALKDTDYIYNAKNQSFGLAISDYAVPFLQLLLSGRISYSSENAGNLCYDLQTQKLQWIEFGSMPYFYLTAESALNLRDTGRDLLFSSTYSEWEDDLVEIYNEFKSKLSVTAGKRMTEHTILSADLRLVKYENGVSIYINYSDREATADGHVIPAKGYIVVGGEG